MPPPSPLLTLLIFLIMIDSTPSFHSFPSVM